MKSFKKEMTKARHIVEIDHTEDGRIPSDYYSYGKISCLNFKEKEQRTILCLLSITKTRLIQIKNG